MSAHSVIVPTSRKGPDPTVRPRGRADCPCECGGRCETACCSLDCLEQPRFFCGQALNDTDLNAIVRWTKDKARLARFRDGWGVACGLEVRCDPARAAGVVVGPGYGMSCCGDDIVVCADTPFDLGDLCKEDDPCAEPSQASVDHRRPRTVDKRDESPSVVSTERVFDIYVRYKEILGRPQAALGHRDCSPSGSECEYARTLESAEIVAVRAGIGTDPTSERIRRWLDGSTECLSVIDRFLGQFGDKATNEKDVEPVRKWLVRWMEDHHPHQFCFLHDAVCDAEPSALAGKNLIRILFLLAQDCRNAYLNGDCLSCTSPSGIPLARVWLDVKSVRGRDACTVACIDGYPPYRRPLSQDRWPAPIGQINVGSAIWQRVDQAQALLRGLPVAWAQEERLELPDTVSELRERLMGIGDPFIGRDYPVRPVIYRDGGDDHVSDLSCGGDPRVVGFEPAGAPHSEKRLFIRDFDALEGTPDESTPPVPEPEQALEPAPPVPEPEPPLAPPRPIEEINGLGGKRGEILRRNGIVSTHELRALSVAELGEMIPDTTISTLKRFIAEAEH